MRILNIIFFASLVGSCWCGLILHNIRDRFHSKLYGHGLHGNQPSPVISINNQQQVNQITANQHLQNRPYGGYSSHQVYGQNGYNTGSSNYAGFNGYTGASASSSLYGGASSSASSSSFGTGGSLKPWSNNY